MNRQLVLEVPDQIYDPLAKNAKRVGATPEQLAVDWLLAASYHASRDPREGFLGAFPTRIPSWPEEHDRLIGEALVYGQVHFPDAL